MDISIIIPTHNRKRKLIQCLESVFQQDYPQENFEVIVVDDGSTDDTPKLLEELSKKHPNLKYFWQPQKGPAAARNFGIKNAKADIVGFTDSDCVLKNDWARKMVEAHRQEQDTALIGGVTEVNRRNIKAAVSQFLSDGAIKTEVNGKAEIIFFPTCNVSFKKSRLKGEEFNEIFLMPAGEDLEFSWRIFKKGHKFSCRQEIKIFHDCNSGIFSFLKQAHMYGRGNYLAQYIHKDHPLLKEIKTQGRLSFFTGLIINFIKIPRFSYLLGRRLIHAQGYSGFYDAFRIYFYFTLHKVVYLTGNVGEYRRVIKIKKDLEAVFCLDGAGVPAKPEFIILDITHRCNLECKICEIRKDAPIDEFTTEEIKGLIEQAIGWGVKEFVISGGEPLVREDIFEIFDFAKEKNYHLGILTNGILLTKDFIAKLLPYLVSDTLSLTISLDALTPEIHDDIRGRKGAFEKTFSCLKTLSGLKTAHPNINFNVISIILNENLEELLNLAEVLKSLNVNSIQFQPLLSNNLIMKERAGKNKYWIPQEHYHLLDKVIDDLVEFKKQNPYLVVNSQDNLRLAKKYFRGLLTNSDINCLYATRTMLIANSAEATTCFGSYANARKVPLRQIWASEEIKNARERVKQCESPCLLPCFTDNGNEGPGVTKASSAESTVFRISRLQIESTNKCNLKCSICWHTLGEVKQCGELSFYDFKKIIDQCEHVKEVNLQGLGEPFLAGDIFLMIDYAKKKDISVWLTTNAVLLTEDYCRKLVESGLSLLRLSIDAAQPELYSRIKVGSDLKKVVENIKILNRIKKEFKSEIPKLAINTVLLKSNINGLKELIELANELQISEISLLPLVVFDMGMAVREESMSSNKGLFFDKISEAKRYAAAYNINIESGISMDRHPEIEGLPQNDSPQCVSGCYITYKGDLTPCCNIGYSFGNIIEKKFIDIWGNKKYTDFRNYILSNKPSCLKCNKDIDQLMILSEI